jgi:hypothetical protein
VPTDVQFFGGGSKSKKSKPRRTVRARRPRPSGEAAHQGRTPQPAVPQGPRNSTKAERRNRAFAAALAVKPPSYHPETAKEKAERRQAAAAVAILRQAQLGPGIHTPKAPTVATASARNTGNRQGFAPSEAEAFAAPALSDLEKLHAEGKIGKSLGVKIYEKIAEGGTYVLPEGAELKAGAEGLAVALRGAAAGDVRVGGSSLLSKVLKPVEATTDADRAAITARATERAAAKEGSGVKAASRKIGERVARTQSKADAAVARRVAGATTRKDAVAAAGVPLKAAKLAGAQTLPVVQGHEKALLEHPGKVAKTTARAIPGLVTVPVGQAVAAGVTAGRAASEGAHALGIPGARGYSGSEILAPVKGLAKEQVEFAKQVAKVVTSDDSQEVQEAVENELGLMLPVMLGLVGKAAGDKVGAVTEGKITEAVRSIADQARATYGGSHGRHRGKAPRVFEKSGQRKREAIRAANAKARVRREVGDRTRTVRREAGKAKGSEVLRRGVAKRGRVIRRKGDLTIHTGDLVNFAVRHALPLDKPAEALAEVRRIGSTLRSSTKSSRPDVISTRDLVGFVERNPGILADKHLRAAVDAYREQARHARETPGISPEHSDRARYVSAAATRGIPLDDERFPASVRDDVRAAPTPGRVAKDVLRRESKSDRQRARRQNRKAATRESRGRAIAAELKVRERAEPGWTKRNAAVRAKGERYANQARTYRAGAQHATELASRKSRAATEIDPGLTDEFTHDVADRLAAEGKPQPEYTATGVGREAPTVGATGAQLTRFPGKSKHRTGAAERYGLVREDLPTLLRESVARPVSRRESYEAMRGFLDDNEFRHGAQTEFTSDQARHLFDTGTIDRDNWVLVDRGLYERALDPEQRAAALQAAIDEDADAALEPGRRYKIVRRTAAEEFMGQLGEAVLPRLAAVNRVTSALILGTSPAWAAAQIVAEYAQAGAAQPRLLNPLYLRKAIAAYKALPEEKRWAFDSWAGITRGEPMGPGEVKLDKRTGDPATAGDAWSVMNTTPLGRLIKSIPHALGSLDQLKGGRIRAAVVVAKMDHDLNSRLPVFLRGVRGLYDEIGKTSAEMKGKPLSEQVAYFADHPKAAERYQSYLDDVMGNWHALTRNEQLASRLVIFYPFVRMAARWTFYAFPRRHPIKAAMLYYLGQQNAVSLEKLLGGDPGFFANWATVPLHLGSKTELIPLSRIAPATGLVSELAGEGGKNLAGTALSSLQPAFAAAVVALTGVDTFSGEQHPGRGAAAVAQLLELSPLSRVANEELIPAGRKATDQALPVLGPLFGSTERQKALDKLFDRLDQTHTAVRAARQLAVPMLPKRLDYERDQLKLTKILKAIDDNSSEKRGDLAEAEEEHAAGVNEAKLRKIELTTARKTERMSATYERAQQQLDAMLKAYKIPADPWTGDVYSIGKYGTAVKNTPPAGMLGGRRVAGSASSPSGSIPPAGTLGGRRRVHVPPARPGGSPSAPRVGRLPPAETLGGVKVR